MVPPIRLEPLPRIVDGILRRPSTRGRAVFLWRGGSCSRAPAAGTRRSSCLAPRARRHGVGQREIDVVAAEQDVFADGDAFELQFAGLLGDRDQREIGGAAADIDHQNQIALLDALAPVGMPLDPGVEGGLRLFEHGDVPVAGSLGGLAGQFARDGVERSGHGDQNFLLVEGRVGMLVVPGMRGDASDIRRTRPPARCASTPSAPSRAAWRPCDRPTNTSSQLLAEETRRLETSAPRRCASLPTTKLGVGVPGQGDRAGRKIALAGNIEERRQQRLRGDFVGVHELRDRRELKRRRLIGQLLRNSRMRVRSWWCQDRCRSNSAASAATPVRFRLARGS